MLISEKILAFEAALALKSPEPIGWRSMGSVSGWLGSVSPEAIPSGLEIVLSTMRKNLENDRLMAICMQNLASMAILRIDSISGFQFMTTSASYFAFIVFEETATESPLATVAALDYLWMAVSEFGNDETKFLQWLDLKPKPKILSPNLPKPDLTFRLRRLTRRLGLLSGCTGLEEVKGLLGSYCESTNAVIKQSAEYGLRVWQIGLENRGS